MAAGHAQQGLDMVACMAAIYKRAQLARLRGRALGVGPGPALRMGSNHCRAHDAIFCHVLCDRWLYDGGKQLCRCSRWQENDPFLTLKDPEQICERALDIVAGWKGLRVGSSPRAWYCHSRRSAVGLCGVYP